MPNLILLPLAESAIANGISVRSGRAAIEIRAWSENGERAPWNVAVPFLSLSEERIARSSRNPRAPASVSAASEVAIL